MTLENIINQYDFNFHYAQALVRDLSDEQMTHVPASGLENHPAFTIGHLISGSALLTEDLGGTFEMPDDWKELFIRKGPGDLRMPDPDKDKYPSKNLLLNELEKQHNKVKQLLRGLEDADMNAAFNWRFSSYMPMLKDLVIFMCITHEAMHLGQLAAWRRAMGLPSSLAML